MYRARQKRRDPGLVNYVPAVAHHSWLVLPEAFTQTGARLLASPVRTGAKSMLPSLQWNEDMSQEVSFRAGPPDGALVVVEGELDEGVALAEVDPGVRS